MSKDVSFRIKNLIEALNDANYDIISLQEVGFQLFWREKLKLRLSNNNKKVWSQRDFIRIRDGIKSKYPYSHYFQSGFIGSGCCVFSQHAITATFYHIYSVNGYFHQIHRGDWFGEKLVGLAVVDYFGININVYVTHVGFNFRPRLEKKFMKKYLEIFYFFLFFGLVACKLRRHGRNRLASSTPICATSWARSIYKLDKRRCLVVTSHRRFEYVRWRARFSVSSTQLESVRLVSGKLG